MYPVAIGVTIMPLQAALALTRRMLKFRTGTLTSQMGCNRFWRRYVILSMISDFKNLTCNKVEVAKFLCSPSPDILRKQNHLKQALHLKD